MRSNIIFALLIITMAALVSCGPKPDIYFKPRISFKPSKSLAILPFNNYSGKEDAGKQVSNVFLVELLKNPNIKVIEPGEVDRVMREQRIRSSEQIDSITARVFKDSLGADFVLIGAVNEFGYIKISDRDIPLVGISTRLLSTSDAQIVWAAYYSRKGDDGEFIFNWGLTTSLSELTRNIVKKLSSSLKHHN